MFHTHDCDKCEALGSAILKLKRLDFYYCADALGLTLVVRFGSNGEDYSSSPIRYLPAILQSIDPVTGAAYRYGLDLYNNR